MQVDIKEDQVDKQRSDLTGVVPALKITEAEFAIEHRSKSFKFYFDLMKLAFVAVTVLCFLKYSARLQKFEEEDLGVVQRWI